MANTLEDLQNEIKRRLRILKVTTDLDTEAESGNFVSNNAINDAINAGRKQVMIAVKNAHVWGWATKTITTAENVQDYIVDTDVLKVLGVMWDTTSAGVWQSATKKAIDIYDIHGESKVIEDPLDEPSTTNPKYRVVTKTDSGGSAAGHYDASVSHTASAVTVTGFSGLTPDEWKGGSINHIDSDLFYTAQITGNDATTVTISVGTDLPAIVTSAVMLKAADPNMAIAVRFVVSEDGTVTASKYAKVEYIKELPVLTTGTDKSQTSITIDNMTIEWAIYILCQHPIPEEAAKAKATFEGQVELINARGF